MAPTDSDAVAPYPPDEKSSNTPSFNAKASDEVRDLDYGREKTVYETDDDGVEYRNGEPIVTTGRDVSRFLVDIRDDGDEALTFRSLVLGTVFAGLGAALSQVTFVVHICTFADTDCLGRMYRFTNSSLSKSEYQMSSCYSSCIPLAIYGPSYCQRGRGQKELDWILWAGLSTSLTLGRSH